MNCFYIIAVRLESRVQNATDLQAVLTRFGCNIKARLGLHEAGEGFCANDGLIILQACGEPTEVEALVTALDGMDGATAKLIDLND